ncbi:MAG: hypothetical protein J6K04_04120 [Lachnospiraceae bacterium]|nr:hypothetical protein [Lachnospiraceae bacterium]
MALGTVQTGYKNSLYTYSVPLREESGNYAEWLAELTTELELALDGGTEESVTEDKTEDDGEQTEAQSRLKKEWEESLEGSDVVEAMLRLLLENGLGQRKEEEQEKQEDNSLENLDSEFELSGIPAASEGNSKDVSEYTERHGNSEFLQSNAGSGAEYWNPTNAGRRYGMNLRTRCLFCETECDRKKQWKITE